MSRFRRNDALVAFLGGELSSDPRPVDLDPAALARMQRALPRAGRVVVVHAGSSERTPHKRYDALGYARVARELAGNDGATVLVARGPGGEERIRAERIVAAAGGAARLAPETPEITDLAALLSLSDLVIAADSGPLHLAALVGTPVVQILGPTDPVENAPFPLAEARILRANLPCSPCRRGCAEASCMRAIVPGQVVAAARDLLGKSSSSEIAGVAG